MPPVDLDVLRALTVVCRQGSISRAADSLARTQSALSMQIRRLEDLMDCALLHRTGRGVVPTHQGEIFLGYALRILALSEEAHARLHGPDLNGTIRIAMPEEIALVTLPRVLGQF